MPDLSPRVAVAALLATLLVAGVWPFHEILGWLPWGADASRWVGSGSLDNPGWWTWCTATRHFVGYRPVTALSFVLNEATTGYAAWGYRATDLLLHLASGALLFVCYRRLTGDRSVISLVPVLVLFVHPASEEVVPYPARRSYLLALTFGLGALVGWLEAHRPDPSVPERRRWGWAVATAALLGLAVLSNEVAYVFAPLLPLVALLRPPSRWGPLLAKLGPSLLVTTLAIALRYRVLGTFGGYQRRLFAFVQDGRPMWRELLEWDPERIATACWTYLLDPTGPSGADPLFAGGAALAWVALFTAWLVWTGLLRPLLRIRDPRERAPLVLAAWMVGALAIVVLSQTWFWRQAHSLLAPLGMLIALGLRQSTDALRARPLLAVPGLAVGIVGLLTLGWNGPLWTGLDRKPHSAAIVGTPLAHRVERLLGQVKGPATVYLVAPMRGTAAHIVRLWGGHYGRREGVEFRLLGHLRPATDPTTARLELKRDEVPPKLVLGAGLMFARTRSIRSLGPGRGLPIDRLWRPGGRETWLFAIDADEGWAVRVPKPPPGVDVIPDEVEPELPDDEG